MCVRQGAHKDVQQDEDIQSGDLRHTTAESREAGK